MPVLAFVLRSLLADALLRASRLVAWFALVALVLLAGGGCVGAGTYALFTARPDAAVAVGVLQAPTAVQPLPTSAAVASIGLSGTALFEAAVAAAPCQVPWPYVAGVASIEDSSFGARHAVGAPIVLKTGLVIHAYGPAQFLIDRWNTYGDQPIARVFVGNQEQPPSPDANIWTPEHAYPALARYLCALGVASDPVQALWRYSGCVPGPGCARTDRYPYDVLARAASYAALPDQQATGSPVADQLLREARTWLGTRYVFGGCTRAGVDCSCYVDLVYATVGVHLPRTTQEQYDATVGRGRGVSTPALGDLAFFRQTYFDPKQTITHVGIVSRVDRTTGAVTIIHAPGARLPTDPPDMPFGEVREEVIGSGFLGQHFAGFARVLPGPSEPIPSPNQA